MVKELIPLKLFLDMVSNPLVDNVTASVEDENAWVLHVSKIRFTWLARLASLDFWLREQSKNRLKEGLPLE